MAGRSLSAGFNRSRLRTLRLKAGLTQEALATRCSQAGHKTSRSNIAKIETGTSAPRPALVLAFVVSLAEDVLGRPFLIQDDQSGQRRAVTQDDLLDPEAVA
jgi:transcriptional regulator with XRE-family HTH domain